MNQGWTQSGPWNNALRMAWSSDGVTFGPSTVFQDSAGVPSVISWKGDTLIAAFQWFREPKPSLTWDRVAVKFSYDGGLSWTEPDPIVVQGIPSNYQRPFDPTLVRFEGDSLRIYFSSSDGLPMGGLDAQVNTYSAISADGIHYTFESGARVDISDKPVIDPAVIYFKDTWHYTAPIGAPQDGAYHYISSDGIQFQQLSSIPSDNVHNWTGNLFIENDNELRFYGSGPMVWYNSSQDGSTWNGFVATNIKGGDPSVVRTAGGQYLLIYVGPPFATSIMVDDQSRAVRIYPNPVLSTLYVDTKSTLSASYRIYGLTGILIADGTIRDQGLNVSLLSAGSYFLEITITGGETYIFHFMKI